MNVFTLYVLSSEKNGFDEITKVLLTSLTAAYLVLGMSFFLINLLSQIDLKLWMSICRYHGFIIHPCFHMTVTSSSWLILNRYFIIL